MQAINASIGFDRKMWRQDIRGSLAHAAMLAHVGIISAGESRKWAGFTFTTGNRVNGIQDGIEIVLVSKRHLGIMAAQVFNPHCRFLSGLEAFQCQLEMPPQTSQTPSTLGFSNLS